MCVGVAASVLAADVGRAQAPATAGVAVGVASYGVSDSRPVAAPLSADSIAALKRFAKAKLPLIIINDSVKTAKAFDALPAEKIASVELKNSAADLKYYGDKAKNGVLVIKTGTSVRRPGRMENTPEALEEAKRRGAVIQLQGGTPMAPSAVPSNP